MLERRYNEVTFPMAHNAYAAPAYANGVPYFQQGVSITEQLRLGVRGFMLDTYAFKAIGAQKGTITLCHGDCTALNFGSYKRVMQELKNFLDANPNEIVTLILENYVGSKDVTQTFEAIYEETGLDDYIFKKGDNWDFATENAWPTISWMIKNNERLVIFQQSDANNPLRDVHRETGDFIYQNKYSVVEGMEQCHLLGEMKSNTTLYLFNHFPKISPLNDMAKINGDLLRNSIERCHFGNPLYASARLVPRYYQPNFVAVDFVNIGDLQKSVRELNARPMSSPDISNFDQAKFHCARYPQGARLNNSECDGNLLWEGWGGPRSITNRIRGLPTYCLDSRRNTAIHTDICRDASENQAFFFNRNGNIGVMESGVFRCVEVSAPSVNALVRAGRCRYGAAEQIFDYSNEGFVHRASGLCLNVNNGTSGPDIRIVLNKCDTKNGGVRIDKQRFALAGWPKP
jgi:hypothetical protein